MAEELTYKNEAAAGYDRAFAPITTHFVPFLLRAGHIASGMRVLDIAAGTGLAAEAALGVVGPTGHITAADLSPAMVEKARARFANAKNVSVADCMPPRLKTRHCAKHNLAHWRNLEWLSGNDPLGPRRCLIRVKNGPFATFDLRLPSLRKRRILHRPFRTISELVRGNMIGETPKQAFLIQRDRLAVFSPKHDLFLPVIDECGLQSHR